MSTLDRLDAGPVQETVTRLEARIAALCAEESQDSLVLTTVSDLETLATSMSRKVWQKISLLPRSG